MNILKCIKLYVILIHIYFKKTYIAKFNVNDCNYYKIHDHKTNNSCESFNHVLKGKFNNKPTIWKFICVIKREENLLKRNKSGIKSFELTMKNYCDVIKFN